MSSFSSDIGTGPGNQEVVEGNDFVYNASDVVRYALTAKGIDYKLREREGAVNAWRPVETTLANSGNTVVKYEGDTDSAGLVSAALRLHGYKKPEETGKEVLSISSLVEAAKENQYGLKIVPHRGILELVKKVRHGDVLARTKPSGGHAIIFNGLSGFGEMHTVEALGPKYGVGNFKRKIKDLKGFKIIRKNDIYPDIKNPMSIITEASAEETTFQK